MVNNKNKTNFPRFFFFIFLVLTLNKRPRTKKNIFQAQGATIPAALMKGCGKGVAGSAGPAPPGSLVAPETGYKAPSLDKKIVLKNILIQ